MFQTVLQQITGLLNNRFLLNAFFPSLVFWGLILIIYLIGQHNLVATYITWNQLDANFKFIQIVGFLGWVTFFSFLLASFWNGIVRFYEGYWNFPGHKFLEDITKGWYEEQLKELNRELEKDPNNPCIEQIYYYYPPTLELKHIMPTRLGNILRNAELYPSLHYGLEPIVIWPRLYHLLPERFVQAIAQAKSDLDFMLVISTLSFAFAIFSFVYLIYVQASWLLFAASFFGGYIIAWFAYLSALEHAFVYAQMLKSGFDLYRNELLKQMSLQLPINNNEEYQKWEQLTQFIFRGGGEFPTSGYNYQNKNSDQSDK